MESTNKMVEIARFQNAMKARELEELLKSEGIDCFVSNEFSTQMMGGYVDMGGVRVELLESDVPRALEVMAAFGYELPVDEETEGVKNVSKWARHLPFLRNLPLEKQIFFFFILIALLLAALIYANKLIG